MKIFLFILFIILAVCFSELLCLYLEDITAYIGGYTFALFIIIKLSDFMERKLAMEWWNNLSYQDKQKILDKYNMIRKPEHLTGREIESIYIKSHKPINV